MHQDTRRTAGTPPPLHGEHTQEILEELGLPAPEITSLRAAGTVT